MRPRGVAEIDEGNKNMYLTHKQLLELKYWLSCDRRETETGLRAEYIKAFGLDKTNLSRHAVLEVGTGPFMGLLAALKCDLKVGVDCLYDAYWKLGIIDDLPDVRRIAEPFEHWETNDQFDIIVTTNALDHGEMGFYLIVKMWRMLKRGGCLYIHVHLRPPELLNLIHDHCLTEAQLDRQLANTDLVEISRVIYPKDVTGNFCKTLVGVWLKP